MIVELLFELVLSLFNVLTSPIKIDAMPDQVSEFLFVSFEYLSTGIALCANYVDMAYILLLFGIVVSADLFMILYRLVIWIAKKIPFLGLQ